MWLITVIDDGQEAKLLEIAKEENARSIFSALVYNGQMSKLEESK